jgi:N-acetylglucosamine-6-phosphate deacetylase
MTTADSQFGFVDLQLNGYAGVDFNIDNLSAEALHTACERLKSDQAAGALATFVTADVETMCARLRQFCALREQDALVRDVLWGIHIEGPFFNPATGYVGAHPPEHIRPAEIGVMEQLLDAAGGLTRIVTLAPDADADQKVIRFLSDRGVIASAGHCNPSLDVLKASIDAGLRMFTHLGNGCPTQMHRHDNIIQRVLSLADRLWVCFIADGAHVPWPALSNYLKVVGLDHAIIVTDGTAASGMGKGRYTIGGIEALVGDDLVPRLPHDPQYFAGSALTMPRAADNLKRHLGLDAQTIERLCCANPRKAINAARS